MGGALVDMITPMKITKGVMISLDGPDGSGKSTLASLLKTWFEKRSVECYIFKPELSERETLWAGNISCYESLERQSQEVESLIKSGVVVIYDRYKYSIEAFRKSKIMAELECPSDFYILAETYDEGLRTPDIPFFIFADYNHSVLRKDAPSNTDILVLNNKETFEDLFFQYGRILEEKGGISIHTSNKSIETVFCELINHVCEYF